MLSCMCSDATGAGDKEVQDEEEEGGDEATARADRWGHQIKEREPLWGQSDLETRVA